MAKRHSWPRWPQTPSTILRRTTPRRNMGVDVPAPTSKRLLISASTPTPLSTIEHLVLLDLLGAPHPLLGSSDVLVSAGTRLRDAGILDAAALGGTFFHTRAAGDISLAYMGDDHLPFLHRGDGATALDLPTLRAWKLILWVFFAEYLGLRPEPSSKRGEPSSPTHPSAPVRKSDSEVVRIRTSV
ncbi:hypothetical protein F5888DRAFT_1639920 [Russula emetica]|nr:hypothetical protein F5888DRAFT_1639920 [Russula emetica]